MKFSRRFLFASFWVVLAIVALVRLAGQQDWFKARAAELEAGESQGQDDNKLKKAMSSINKSMGGKETPILVEAEPVKQGELIQRISAQGRVHGYLQLDVVSELTAPLASIEVKDGQTVKKGDVIARLDEREFRMAVKEANSQLLSAKAEYLTYDQGLEPNRSSGGAIEERLEQLDQRRSKGEIDAESYRQERFMLELEQLRSGSKRNDVIAARTLDQAMVAVERAEWNLEKCTIRAPFDGVIFDLSVTAGQYLNPGTKIARLVNLNNLVVKGKVLESEIGQVIEGRSAKISFTAYPDMEPVDGVVEAVSPFVNEEDKTVDTLIRFDNREGQIKPGMFAEVTLDAAILEDRLMVPKTAILPRDDRIVVFKISEDNRAKWEYVETGAENDQFVEITRGDLAPGDLVLTNNHFTMGHDTLVKVIK